jgi:hypothetical protein
MGQTVEEAMRATPVLKTTAILAALSFATLVTGSAALAQQSQPSGGQTMPPPAEEGTLQGGTAADVAAPPARSSMSTDVAAEAGQPAVIPLSSPTPVEQAYLLKAGDPNVISNPPVPDTPATRRAFGGPDSNGGKKTRPVGN